MAYSQLQWRGWKISADYSCLRQHMTQHRVLAMCIRLPVGCLFDLLRCIFNVVWCGDLNHGTDIIKALGIFSSVWLLYGFLYISSIVSRCQSSVSRTGSCLIGNHQTNAKSAIFFATKDTLSLSPFSFQNNFTHAFFSCDTAHHNPQQNSFLHEKHQWTFLQLVDHILLLIKNHCTITINLPRWRAA